MDEVTGGHGGPPLHCRHNESVGAEAALARLKEDESPPVTRVALGNLSGAMSVFEAGNLAST